MRLITWGDLFWLVNISAAMLMMLLSGELQKAKIQAGEYLQISGLSVGVTFLIVVPLLFGSSALWAYRRSVPVQSSLN